MEQNWSLTVNSLLAQHKESEGNYERVLKFVLGLYEKAKKQSLDKKKIPHELGIYEKIFQKGLKEKNLFIFLGSIENMRRIYQLYGIKPNEHDHAGKYVILRLFDEFCSFGEIVLSMENSGWTMY